MTELGHRASTATSGRATVSGVRGHGASLPEVTSEDAFIAQRGDHLGLTLAMRRATLEWLLPQGTTLYAGLWLEMPDRTGSGGVEVDATGYARQPIAQWLNVVNGASARRNNASSLLWGPFDESVSVVGWGLWSALTGGTLRCFDWIRTSGPDLNPTSRTVPVGDRFGIGSGRTGIGLVL